MKTLKVTQLEAQALTEIANGMYAELGFSDFGSSDMKCMEMRILRGVLGSLEKKGFIEIDHRETEGYKYQPDMHIIYLIGDAVGLVDHWVGERYWQDDTEVEEATLEINN